MNLLWRGIATYVLQHDIAVMFGCASLPGIEPKALATPLSYLYYHHLAPPAVRTKALPSRYVDMRLLAPGDVDPRQGLAELPPLVKGYLRLGGFIGDGAVIDEQFNTTDVCIIVKTDLITDKYLQHYTRKSSES
jgi:putative hemolysin